MFSGAVRCGSGWDGDGGCVEEQSGRYPLALRAPSGRQRGVARGQLPLAESQPRRDASHRMLIHTHTLAHARPASSNVINFLVITGCRLLTMSNTNLHSTLQVLSHQSVPLPLT